MTRISTACAVGGILAALALTGTTPAWAPSVDMFHTPNVNVHVVSPKLMNTPTPKTNPNGGGSNQFGIENPTSGPKTNGAIGSATGGGGTGKQR